MSADLLRFELRNLCYGMSGVNADENTTCECIG